MISTGELVTALDIVGDRGSTCYLCEFEIDLTLRWPAEMSLSMDHVIPISRGGPHTRDNLRPAHLVCNLKKGAKMLQDIPS